MGNPGTKELEILTELIHETIQSTHTVLGYISTQLKTVQLILFRPVAN